MNIKRHWTTFVDLFVVFSSLFVLGAAAAGHMDDSMVAFQILFVVSIFYGRMLFDVLG